MNDYGVSEISKMEIVMDKIDQMIHRKKKQRNEFGNEENQSKIDQNKIKYPN